MDPFLQALTRYKSRVELEADLKKALDDAASGVTVTAYSFEGQNTTFQRNMDPVELVRLLQTAINILNGRPVAGRWPSVDFSWRRIEA